MRDIKFRSWDGAKMFLSPDISEPHHLSSWFDAHSKYGNIPAVSFMQFTGLLDKNGKEIYEGDVVLVIDPYDEDKKIITIEFNKGVYEIKWPSMFHGGDCDVTAISYAEQAGFTFEVIGNIYENPELLNP